MGMTPEQRAKVEANREKALKRLREKGILPNAQLQEIEKRNSPAPVVTQPSPAAVDRPGQGREVGPQIMPEVRDAASLQRQQSSNIYSDWPTNDLGEAGSDRNGKRPLDKIRPTIRTKDYIEYDFSTMENLYGGYINPKDRNGEEFDVYGDEMGSKKQKTLDDWKREQQERRHVYENAPPPEHMSAAPKCIECNINIEMDPILHDIFKLRVCKRCAKDVPEKYALLTKTECKDDYFLTDPELNDTNLFHKLEKPNPHSGTFARMQLFVRCEVEQFAFKKWGSEEGLDAEWQRREEGKTKRREKKYQDKMKQMRLKTRAQEFTNRLKEKKYGAAHTHEFGEPVDGGKDEDGYDITKKRCLGCGLEIKEVSI